MNWKDTYTKIFLKNLNIAVTQATLKEYMPQWWQNTRAKDEGGLRLTDEGLRVIVRFTTIYIRCAVSKRLSYNHTNYYLLR